MSCFFIGYVLSPSVWIQSRTRGVDNLPCSFNSWKSETDSLLLGLAKMYCHTKVASTHEMSTLITQTLLCSSFLGSLSYSLTQKQKRTTLEPLGKGLQDMKQTENCRYLHQHSLNPGRLCSTTQQPETPNSKPPRPSHVVPYWVVYYNPLPKNHNKPKKELHWSPWA